MKAKIQNLTGSTISCSIDISDPPIAILRHLYDEDPTSASQLFADQRAIDQMMEGNVDERSAFDLISVEGDNIRAAWKTALCNQPELKAELARIEADGQIPTFVVTVAGIVAGL